MRTEIHKTVDTSAEPDAGARLSAFAGALLDPDVATPGELHDFHGRPAGKRFSVYRNNVVVGLMDALSATYPSVLAIMGEENFRLAARNFIVRHPPVSAMMLGYGSGFADFLNGFPPLRKSPFVADLARLEWLWLESFHAADAASLDPASVAAIDHDEAASIRFTANPATRLLNSRFPIAELFARRYGNADRAIDLNRGQAVVVARRDLEVGVYPVEPAVYQFIDCLLDGDTLGAAADAAMEVDEGLDLASALGAALAMGIFTGFALSDRLAGREGAQNHD